MAEKFDRSASLTFGTFVEGAREPESAFKIEDLRMIFNTAKTKKSDPNASEVTIFNLSRDTIGKLEEKDTAVVLEAGYVGATKIIIVGQIKDIRHQRQGPDRLSKLEIGDGVKPLSETRISESFEPGVTYKDAFLKIADKLVVPIGEVKGLIEDELINGLSSIGLAKDALERLAKKMGLDWSIQDGELFAIPKDGASTEAALVISPFTGMIGSPTKTEKGVQIQMLLEGDARIGRIIDLRAELLKGVYVIDKVDHSGDTQQDEWLTKIEANLLQAA